MSLYGVGAGEADSPDGEGDASVSAALFFAAVLFFPGDRVGDGVGETLAVAAPLVEVAVVPCCVQETINAAPIRTVINVKTDFFILQLSSRTAECLVAR